jgi:tetratricopeptide (TPR) repeat protein
MLGWLFKSGKQAAPARRPAPEGETALEQAIQHHREGRLQQAQGAYRALLAADPENADALHLLGVAEFQEGHLEQAAALIERALAHAEGNAAAHSNLGNVRAAQGRLEEAVRSYRKALELQPEFPDALLNLANARSRMGQPQEAAALLESALRLDPGLAEAHCSLGSVLRDLGRREEAEARCRAALALKPGLAQAHCNLGAVLEDAGKSEEAIGCYRRALDLSPAFAEARASLGNALMSVGELREAGEQLREALRLDPALERARFALASWLLMQGDYAAGLPLYEARFAQGALSGMYAGLRGRVAAFQGVARWQGEAPAGRTLLAWSEQGLGDSLMMLRYLPLLKDHGFGGVIAYCDGELERLVRSLPGVDEVITRDAPPPLGRVDLHCPLMSLPLAFGTRLGTIPRRVPYLFPPEALQRAWAARLPAAPVARVGLAWAGGSRYPRNPQRSLRLAEYAPLLAMRGVRFVSLQQGDAAAQLGESGADVTDWMRECADLADTAALMCALDLVITVDTAMAHLAGALGRPVWMLNRFESEWRWLFEGEDAPWYPSMRVFRQPAPGRWDAVVARIAGELRAWLAARGTHG